MVLACYICKWRKDAEPKRSFHKFPTDEALKQKWLYALGKSDEVVSKTNVLCSYHFENHCFRDNFDGGKKILKADSIPTRCINKTMDSDLMYGDNPKFEISFVQAISKEEVDLKYESYPMEEVTVNSTGHQGEGSPVYLEDIAMSGSNLQSGEFSHSCRTCLVKTEEYESIFANENASNTTYAKIITELTSIQISEEDAPTVRICLSCVKRLKDADDFRKQCILADNILNSQEGTIVLDDTSLSIGDQTSLTDPDQPLEFDNLKEEMLEVEIKDETLLLAADPQSAENCLNGPEKLFVCKRCDKRFETLEILKRHFRRTCKNKPVQCAICGKKKEADHTCIETEEVQCPKCPEICKSFFSLSRHMLTHDSLICIWCGKKFTKKGNLCRHFLLHSNDSSFTCQYCHKQFTRKYYLLRHLRFKCEKRTGDEWLTTFECINCDKVFSNSLTLIEHWRNDHNSAPLQCKLCDQNFETYKSLYLHITNEHCNSEKFMCSECGKTFKFKQAMFRHMRIHTGEKPFKCLVCSMQFRQFSHLSVHQRTHTGERSCKCKHCGKCFRFISSLRDHERKHTGELLPYECIVCPKKFSTYSAISSHKKRHHQCLGNFIRKINVEAS